MAKSVIVSVFKVESEGYQALSELKQEPQTDEYLISAAALVKKEDGACKVIDTFDTGTDTANDTAFGGLLGMTVGILGGPLGMLLGASYGALVGMSFDAVDADFGVSMLEQVSAKLDEGMLALIALADETKEKYLDEKLSAFDTVIARFDPDVVAEEVKRADQMQREMARQARMELRKEKKEKLHKGFEEKKEKVKNAFK